jgi:hypothetical protein
MPESCWASYLPGDEPGYRCSVNDEPCGEVDHTDCPLFDETDNFICTLFGVDGYCEEKCKRILIRNEDEVICPDSEEEIEYILIGDKYIVGVTNMETLSSFDKDPETQKQIKSNFEKAILLTS